MDWSFECISGDYFPRQFEYHPQNLDQLIFGTVFGEVCGVNLSSKEIVSYGFKGKNKRDTILGLRWMKQNQNHLFFAGTAEGKLTCNDSRTGDIVKEFDDFDKLTSVHLSCDNRSLLISGYRKDAHIYDVETGKVIRQYGDIHKDHINISRFTNHSPTLFSTSSFDSTIKTWDTRMSGTQPIYSLQANSGVVMINFSSDDNFILASALDNEIKQYLFVDGRLHLQYDLPTTGLKGNFTRAYYSASGKYTITGACEERNVKFLCSYTGEYLSSVDMYPGRRDKSIYIQSLRGSPCSDNEFCVLANYRDSVHRELIVARGAVHRPNKIVGYNSIESTVSANAIEEPEMSGNNDLMHIGEYLPFSSSKLCEELFKLRLSLLKESNVNEEVITLVHRVHESEEETGKQNGQYPMFRSGEQTGSFHVDMDALLQLCHGKGFHRVHSFIALSRCPSLYQLYQQQRLDSSKEEDSATIDLSIIPSQLWYLISLVIDYLYLGFNALEITSLKGYALANYFAPKNHETWETEKNRIMNQMQGMLGSEVDELTLMSVDESIWKLNPGLSHSLCDVMFGLFEIGKILSIQNLISKCCDLLGDLLHPNNVVHVSIWAWSHQQLTLYEKCLVFSLKCSNIILFHSNGVSDRKMSLIDACRQLDDIANLEISEDEIRLLRDISKKMDHHMPLVVTRADIAKGKSSRMISATVAFEDAPFLADTSNQITHTVMQKQYNHASCVLQDRFIVFFGGMSADRWLHLSKLLAYDTLNKLFFYIDCSGTRIPTMSNYCAALPLTKHNASKCLLMGGKIRKGERAESKASTKTNYIWHSLNKKKINGLNPKAVVKSIARYEEEEDEAEKDVANLDPNRVFVHEFDFHNACWTLVKVAIEDGHDAKKRTNMRYRRNRIFEEGDADDRVLQSEKSLIIAFNRRLAGTTVPLFLEDVPYQCAACLFSKNSHDSSICNCAYTTAPNAPSDAASYMLQFGGYCLQREEFCNDLHVLVCRAVEDEIASVSSTPRYQYTWKKVNTYGDAPSPRYSHAAALIPANEKYPVNNVARMFIHGGASFMGQVEDLCCLQIKSMKFTSNIVDAQWIPVRVVGSHPPRRYKHTLNYVSSSNICLMFGGCAIGQPTQVEAYNNDLWALSWSYSQDLRLECTWTLISHDSPMAPPSRSYHTANVVSENSSSNCQFFVFGGTNESIGSPLARDETFEQRIKESVMHVCDVSKNENNQYPAEWQSIVANPSRLLLVEREPNQSLSFCSLGADLRNLLFSREFGDVFKGENMNLQWQQSIADVLNQSDDSMDRKLNPFLPNVKILVPIDNDSDIFSPSVADAESIDHENSPHHIVSSYSSLITGRCPVFEAMLSGSMVEAQTNLIRLTGKTNFQLFKRLMIFLYSNYIGSLELQEMVEFLGLANEYGVIALVKKCEGALLRMISFSTVCEILSYAEWLGLDILRLACYAQLFRSSNVLELISDSACEELTPEEMEHAAVGGEDEDEENISVISMAVFKQLPQEARVKFAQFAKNQNHVAISIVG